MLWYNFTVGKILTIVNQKGGVGKTTTAINLSASLALAEKDILVIDTDPQGNLTSGLGINKLDLRGSLYDVYMGRLSLRDIITSTQIEPAHPVPYFLIASIAASFTFG